MKLSIVIPVYNEEAIIEETLSVLSTVMVKLPREIDWEIVVADNGSTDQTRTKVIESKLPKVSFFSIKEKGKGLGIRSVAMKSEVDFFGFIDADLSANPESIISMLEILQTKKADIVIGSRLIDESRVHRSIFRTISSKIFNFIQRMILGLNIKDTQCGLKIMNKTGLEVFKMCKEKSWFFDVEFLCLAKKKNLKISELPVYWEEYRYKDRKAKLKVVRDGFSAIITMIKIKNRLNKK